MEILGATFESLDSQETQPPPGATSDNPIEVVPDYDSDETVPPVDSQETIPPVDSQETIPPVDSQETIPPGDSGEDNTHRGQKRAREPGSLTPVFLQRGAEECNCTYTSSSPLDESLFTPEFLQSGAEGSSLLWTQTAFSPDCRRCGLLEEELRLLKRQRNRLQKELSELRQKVPGFPDWFNIKYQSDDAIYTYRLLDDWQEGDLKLVVTPRPHSLVNASATAHAPAGPTAHAPARPTAHAPAGPTAHAPAGPTAHAPAGPTAHAPARSTAHAPAGPTAHAPADSTARPTARALARRLLDIQQHSDVSRNGSEPDMTAADTMDETLVEPSSAECSMEED